ncbi:MAG: hypothetical protein HYY50_01675 [Candidatus Kerfeldbacteria bacterium]|nr:hypothetical protein [Candidatus Kerfeldbacteria bacterium]
MDPHIRQLLEEIYQSQPALRQQEPQLAAWLEQFMVARPTVQLTPDFRQQLRQKLLAAARSTSQPPSLSTDSWFMPKWIIPAAATAVIIAVAIPLTNLLMPKAPPTTTGPGVTIATVGADAFGSLASATKQSLSATSPTGGAAERRSATAPVTADDSTGLGTGVGTTIVEPVPPESVKRYEFIYDGPIAIPDLPILMRQATLRAGTVTGLIDDVGLIGSEPFRSYQPQYLTVAQSVADGLTLSIDYVNGSISLYRNQTVALDRGISVGVESPVSLEQVQLASLPPDDELITVANRFLDQYGISRQGFGQPIVNKDFLRYEIMAQTDMVYAPQELTVVYPWQINGQPVYDESGNRYGLVVNVNAVTKTVSGVSNLVTLSFQASDYAREDDSDKIVEVAKHGGLYSYQPEPAEGVETVKIQLGQPASGYMISRYQLDQTSSEFLVPALIFPITSVPSGEQLYQSSIIVPVVKDLLAQGDATIKPMPLPAEGGGSEPSSAGPVNAESDSQP